MTPENPLERVAKKAVAIMEHLLLQKPNGNCKAKQLKNNLARRLALWTAGDINLLLAEASEIQQRLPQRQAMSEESFRRTFAKLIFEGRINSALRLLGKSVVKGGGKGG